MEAPSPARLYATVVGALLVVLGIVGFFYGASFGGAGSVEAALGALRTNAWLNLLYLAVGGVGVLVAGASSRSYALAAGWLFTVMAIWGWANGGDLILGFIPASGANEALHLALGLLGLGAAAATPSEKPQRQRDRRLRGSKDTKRVPKEPRNSKARAKAARQRA